ncbi:MAG TPA: type III-A CRISPR-associated RAMP protein Csm4 [Chitinophagales bacterium]|nr:type III-A CRISPR-associated RAMP protein Csm4 [Chitinophagales bacterium]
MTTTYTAILLRNFKGPLHLSLGKEDSYDRTQTLLHSDTLKSAIAVCALQLGLTNGGDELRQFMESFLISSAYPVANTNKPEPIYFFPKPNIADRLTVANDAKKAKKVEYVSKDLFEALLSSSQTLSDTSGKFAFLPSAEMPNELKVFSTEPNQHVMIPRDGSGDSNPYFVDKLYFNDHCGLFFLTNATGETLKKVKACMRLLGDNGIGTDRTTGHGQFEFDPATDARTIDLLLPDAPNDEGMVLYQMALSLYCPETNEIPKQVLEKSYYDLIKRGGYIAAPENDNHLTIRKKTVYMFTEGSVFPHASDRKGKIVDLKPKDGDLQDKRQPIVEHPIWRDGLALFVPILHKEDSDKSIS